MNLHVQALAHQRRQQDLARAEARRLAKLAHPANRHRDRWLRRADAPATVPCPEPARLLPAGGC